MKNESKAFGIKHITKGKHAREYAVENYSWKKTLQNVIEIYEGAIKPFI
jgi:hypothetical protein